MTARLLPVAWLVVGATLAAGPIAGPGATGPDSPDPPHDITELWVNPTDLERRDLFDGPWGAAMAPDPAATYTFVEPKRGGVNPGMTVRDPQGRIWKVKQGPRSALRNPEGPIEVTLSRVLSAVGYHQPPVYFVGSFLLDVDGRVRRVPGGRFRLTPPWLRTRGEWSWMSNPHTHTWEQRGLLVILAMFNSTDLKDANNTLYEYRPPGAPTPQRWYVVRDLGAALGETGRLAPVRGDPRVFERLGFIRGIRDGFVEFEYRARHEVLYARRITPGDVVWASRLMSRLSPAQWRDAFRAGGYQPERADRFIAKLQQKIAQGLAVAEPPPGLTGHGQSPW